MKPGSRIGPYEVQATLGRGGQGTVLRVVDTTSGAVRALKILEVRGFGDRTLERMRREARMLSDLDHPGLVRCHEFFERYAEGTAGLVMDAVAGRSLADAAVDPRMDDAHRWSVLRQVAAALAHLHARGLVHRDVKEDNVLVDDRFWDDPDIPGGVKVVDFGIAVVAGNPQAITADGGFIGTLPYLAPEVLQPPPGFDPDTPRRDVFAFGVMACQLLHGRHPTHCPVDANLWDYIRAYRAMAATAWGASLHPVVRACLELDSGRRPPDASAVLAALANPTGTAPMHSPPPAEATIPWTGAPSPRPPRVTQAAAPMGATPIPTTPIPATPIPTTPIPRTPIPGAAYVVATPLPPPSWTTPRPSRRGIAIALGLGGLAGLALLFSAGGVLVLASGGFNARPSPRPTETVAPPSSPPSQTCDCAKVHVANVRYPFPRVHSGPCSDRSSATSYAVHPVGFSKGSSASKYTVCFGSTCLPAHGEASRSGFAISASTLRAGTQQFHVYDERASYVASGTLPRLPVPFEHETLCRGFRAGATVGTLFFFLAPK